MCKYICYLKTLFMMLFTLVLSGFSFLFYLFIFNKQAFTDLLRNYFSNGFELAHTYFKFMHNNDTSYLLIVFFFLLIYNSYLITEYFYFNKEKRCHNG